MFSCSLSSVAVEFLFLPLQHFKTGRTGLTPLIFARGHESSQAFQTGIRAESSSLRRTGNGPRWLNLENNQPVIPITNPAVFHSFPQPTPDIYFFLVTCDLYSRSPKVKLWVHARQSHPIRQP